MTLLVLGINHKSAPIKLREKLAFDVDTLVQDHCSLREQANLREVVILSTCNRTEIYAATEDGDASKILSWLSQHRQVALTEFSDKAYEHKDAAAVRHAMEVACGLDSMILGEPQILGQLKTAYANAQQANTLGPEFSRLFQHVFSTAKEVRTETELGAHPVSLAYVSLSMAKRIFTNIQQSRVLLIGAGEMMSLVAKHFFDNGIKQITVANRTIEKADLIAQQVNGRGITLGDLPDYLHTMDIVITSTAAPVPILGKGTVETALKQRKHQPMLMVDLAVPRDIETEVSELSDIYLYTIDDLQSVINDNIKNRETAGQEARSIIDKCCASYFDLKKERRAVGAVKAYRNKVEGIYASELEKSIKAIQDKNTETVSQQQLEEILERFGKNLINKVMHEPSIALKKAAAEERLDQLTWSKELLGLSANEVSSMDEHRSQDANSANARNSKKSETKH